MSVSRTEEATPSYRDFYYTSPDGLRLYARDYDAGDSTSAAVVCLPGLTRNARDFHRLAERLSTDPERPRRVVAFDYRGRGRSERDRRHASYTLATESEDVLAGMAALGLHRAAFIGTSRGALIIHVLAAMRPGAIAAAVLNDAGPVIEGTGLAQIREYLGRMPSPAGMPEAAALLKQAHGRAFPKLTDADWQEMAGAIYVRDEKGRLVADYDPAILAQLKDLDFNTPLPTLWPQFDALCNVPLMTIRGENSDLLAQGTVDEMRRRHPEMTVLTAKSQGHPPLLHIDGIDQEIANFLSAHDPA